MTERPPPAPPPPPPEPSPAADGALAWSKSAWELIASDPNYAEAESEFLAEHRRRMRNAVRVAEEAALERKPSGGEGETSLLEEQGSHLPTLLEETRTDSLSDEILSLGARDGVAGDAEALFDKLGVGKRRQTTDAGDAEQGRSVAIWRHLHQGISDLCNSAAVEMPLLAPRRQRAPGLETPAVPASPSTSGSASATFAGTIGNALQSLAGKSFTRKIGGCTASTFPQVWRGVILIPPNWVGAIASSDASTGTDDILRAQRRASSSYLSTAGEAVTRSSSSITRSDRTSGRTTCARSSSSTMASLQDVELTRASQWSNDDDGGDDAGSTEEPASLTLTTRSFEGAAQCRLRGRMLLKERGNEAVFPAWLSVEQWALLGGDCRDLGGLGPSSSGDGEQQGQLAPTAPNPADHGQIESPGKACHGDQEDRRLRYSTVLCDSVAGGEFDVPDSITLPPRRVLRSENRMKLPPLRPLRTRMKDRGRNTESGSAGANGCASRRTSMTMAVLGATPSRKTAPVRDGGEVVHGPACARTDAFSGTGMGTSAGTNTSVSTTIPRNPESSERRPPPKTDRRDHPNLLAHVLRLEGEKSREDHRARRVWGERENFIDLSVGGRAWGPAGDREWKRVLRARREERKAEQAMVPRRAATAAEDGTAGAGAVACAGSAATQQAEQADATAEVGRVKVRLHFVFQYNPGKYPPGFRLPRYSRRLALSSHSHSLRVSSIPSMPLSTPRGSLVPLTAACAAQSGRVTAQMAGPEVAEKPALKFGARETRSTVASRADLETRAGTEVDADEMASTKASSKTSLFSTSSFFSRGSSGGRSRGSGRSSCAAGSSVGNSGGKRWSLPPISFSQFPFGTNGLSDSNGVNIDSRKTSRDSVLSSFSTCSGNSNSEVPPGGGGVFDPTELQFTVLDCGRNNFQYSVQARGGCTWDNPFPAAAAAADVDSVRTVIVGRSVCSQSCCCLLLRQ